MFIEKHGLPLSYLDTLNNSSMWKFEEYLFLKSSQVTFIYIALFTIQIVSKQLHADNMKVAQHRSTTLLNNPN